MCFLEESGMSDFHIFLITNGAMKAGLSAFLREKTIFAQSDATLA